MDDKNVLVEVYKQECENIRFFEDLKLKFHFFVFTGVFLAFGFFFKNSVVFNQRLFFLALFAVFMAFVIIVVISIFSAIENKHKKRMARLSKITDRLGLHQIKIYKSYGPSRYYGVNNFVFVLYFFIFSYCIYLVCESIFLFFKI